MAAPTFATSYGSHKAPLREGKVVYIHPEGRFYTLEFKWWNGRHAGFRHQFLVSEGSSPFFCTSKKTRSGPESSGAVCGSFCLFKRQKQSKSA